MKKFMGIICYIISVFIIYKTCIKLWDISHIFSVIYTIIAHRISVRLLSNLVLDFEEDCDDE